MSHPLANGLLAFLVLCPLVARAEPPLAGALVETPRPGQSLPSRTNPKIYSVMQ